MTHIEKKNNMQFQLFFFFFFLFSFHTTALSNHNSSLNIELHQCNTNETIVNSTIIITDEIFNSCDFDCCTTNDSNICQVTLQSSTNVCLGRLCYSGVCDEFLSLTNMTFKQKNTTRPSFASIIHSTGIKWPLWEDKSYLSIRYSILILLLIANFSLTLITLFIVIKSIRHAKMIAERKLSRYSLF